MQNHMEKKICNDMETVFMQEVPALQCRGTCFCAAAIQWCAGRPPAPTAQRPQRQDSEPPAQELKEGFCAGWTQAEDM